MRRAVQGQRVSHLVSNGIIMLRLYLVILFEAYFLAKWYPLTVFSFHPFKTGLQQSEMMDFGISTALFSPHLLKSAWHTIKAR